MREVAARNHEDVIPPTRAPGIPDPEGRLASLISHHHRHNRHTAQQVRDKWKLHLQRVLASVGVTMSMTSGDSDAILSASSSATAPARAGSPRHPRPDRHTAEPDEVRRTDEHRGAVRRLTRRFVSERGDRARVFQTRMRRHDRDRRRNSIHRRASDVAIHVATQPIGRCGIPTSRYRRRPHVTGHETS